MLSAFRHITLLIFGVLLSFVISCISPFEFESEEVLETMVVEGLLTDQEDYNYVVLYNTRGFNDTEVQFQTEATVSVLNSNGTSYAYLHEGEGRYVPPVGFVGVPGESYQLIIELGGERYYTEPNTLIQSNEIEVVGRVVNIPNPDFGGNVEGVQFFVESSSTPTASHFRFEWEDTYLILVPYPTWYKLVDGVVEDIETSVARCYGTDQSDQVLVKSILQQTDKSLQEFPIRFIPEGSQAFRSRYALSVRQYTLTAEAFNYFEQLKKNNEGGGSLFDRQNGPLLGNIKNDNQKIALGYFQVSSVTEIREFYLLREFGEQLFVPPFPAFCPTSLIVTTLDSVDLLQRIGWGINDVLPVAPFVSNYAMNFGACTDCTRLGDLKRPEWWED